MIATLIDANVLLRILLHDYELDDESRFHVAKRFLTSQPDSSCILTAVVAAEVVYIMLGAGCTRQAISVAIDDLMQHASLAYDDSWLSRGLELYGATSLDFVDCYLMARSLQTGEALRSFDRPMLKRYQKLQEQTPGTPSILPGREEHTR